MAEPTESSIVTSLLLKRSTTASLRLWILVEVLIDYWRRELTMWRGAFTNYLAARRVTRVIIWFCHQGSLDWLWLFTVIDHGGKGRVTTDLIKWKAAPLVRHTRDVRVFGYLSEDHFVFWRITRIICFVSSVFCAENISDGFTCTKILKRRRACTHCASVNENGEMMVLVVGELRLKVGVEGF